MQPNHKLYGPLCISRKVRRPADQQEEAAAYLALDCSWPASQSAAAVPGGVGRAAGDWGVTGVAMDDCESWLECGLSSGVLHCVALRMSDARFSGVSGTRSVSITGLLLAAAAGSFP